MGIKQLIHDIVNLPIKISCVIVKLRLIELPRLVAVGQDTINGFQINVYRDGEMPADSAGHCVIK